jgi:hypothetical protein
MGALTPINRWFLGFMSVAGLAAGSALIAKPELRDFRISPYFWILIAMALFEFAAFARGRGAPGTMIAMEIRLLGFIVAVVLMVALPVIAGSPGRLF